MATHRPFRFGVNQIELGDQAGWQRSCRRAEDLGYDVVLVPDHLGMPAPFPALVAAGAATSTVRLGTFVLNAAFYNPTLLAREVAATDALIAGRLELGLGAGYVKDEFDTAGLAYGQPGERLDHLAATVDRVRELLGDPGHRPAPAQDPIPVLLGGNGDRMLRLAARRADTVGFTGASSDAAGNLTLVTPDVLEERVGFARAAAGDRVDDIEWNVLVQTVVITDDRDAVAAQWHEHVPSVTHEEILGLPTILAGTPEQIAEELLAHRERFGFTYVTVLGPSMEAFAEVIPLLRDA